MSEELNLVERAQDEILRYISSHPETNQLPKEQELADILGVSRVVVREALSRLRVLGVVETKKKKGTVVTQPEVFGMINKVISSGLLNKDSLRDLYQLRIMLEIGMADFVFKNKTEGQMAELEALMAEESEIRRQRSCAPPSEKLAHAQRLRDIDVQFHSILFQMTGNKSLMDFHAILQHLFTIYFPSDERDFHDETIVSHIGLYNILRIGNSETFRMAMRLHLQRQIDSIEQVLDRTEREIHAGDK